MRADEDSGREEQAREREKMKSSQAYFGSISVGCWAEERLMSVVGWGARCKYASTDLLNCERVTMLQLLAYVLRSFNFHALVCGVCRACLTRPCQPWSASPVQCLFYRKNCNQESVGRGKCICKLIHHTPDYSLSKHWKFSVWPAGHR